MDTATWTPLAALKGTTDPLFCVSFHPRWCLVNYMWLLNYGAGKVSIYVISGCHKSQRKKPWAYICLADDTKLSQVRDSHVRDELDRAVPVSLDLVKMWGRITNPERVFSEGI